MEFKRICIILFLFLFIMSIYKDLTTGIIKNTLNTKIDTEITEKANIRTAKIKVYPGDTVLSIVEQINNNHHQTPNIDIEQIIIDFKKINPDADPYKLEIFKYYYFPLYHNNI
ncbi:hypothetical protein [Virgibacillus alimentarius]|uniref:hypothetical protein n=1 Tax=Virgibacillus alimentarius TaxID=698769 RepID=UPI0006924FBB|nr:hypothetical protein [Virgibacillus alimentarius]